MQAPSPLSTALEKLRHFTLTSPQRPADEPWLGRAVDAWFAGGERVLTDSAQTSFSGYLAHGHADERGDRMIDRFLRAPRSGLSADERAALAMVRTRAFVSLFEIVEVRLDVGLELLDRVSGEQLFVREKLGTRGAAEGDQLLAWLCPFDDHVELLGSMSQVPPAHVVAVEAAIAEGIRRHFSPLQRGLPWAALPAVHRVLRDAVRDYDPTFVHEGGEPVLICRAMYEVKATDAVREKLSACAELEAGTKGRFFWWPEGQRGRPDQLAEIQVRTVRLSVQTLSRSALAPARRFVERLLGKLAQHRVDRFEDPLGRPLASEDAASSRGRLPAERVVLAADVEASIAGFQRQIDAHIRGTLPSPDPGEPSHEGAVGPPAPPAGPAPEAAEKPPEPRAHPPEIDPEARLHRLPPAGHEVMQALVPGLRDLVRDVRGAPGERRTRRPAVSLRTTSSTSPAWSGSCSSTLAR